MGFDLQVFLHLVNTGGNEPPPSFPDNLNHAETTGSVRFQFFVMAEGGNSNARTFCDLKNRRPLMCLYRFAVDFQIDFFHLGSPFYAAMAVDREVSDVLITAENLLGQAA